MALNYELLKNPSFLLPFLFDLYSIFSLDISFKTYLALLSAELFGEFDLFDVFFFDISRNFKIFLFLICILNIFFPFLSTSVLFFGKMLSFIQKIDIPIRGELDLLWLIVFISLCRHAFMDARWKKFLLLIFLILFPLKDPFLQVGFIDVGQGDSAYIKIPFSRSCILIDTGSPYNYYKLKRFLLKKGIYQIDELIITHNDSDHNGNIETLKEDFQVKEIWSITGCFSIIWMPESMTMTTTIPWSIFWMCRDFLFCLPGISRQRSNESLPTPMISRGSMCSRHPITVRRRERVNTSFPSFCQGSASFRHRDSMAIRIRKFWMSLTGIRQRSIRRICLLRSSFFLAVFSPLSQRANVNLL